MPVDRLSLTVPGPPVPAKRPRVTRTHAYIPVDHRQHVRNIQAVWIAEGRPALPEGRPLRATVKSFIQRPKSHYKTDGSLRDGAPECPASKRSGDVDNFAKLALDALNELAFEDDSLVTDLRTCKEYAAGDPYTEITVWAF